MGMLMVILARLSEPTFLMTSLAGFTTEMGLNPMMGSLRCTQGRTTSTRWARSAVGTIRTTLVIFTRNPATVLKAVLASSSHGTRFGQPQDWSVVTQLEERCGSC